jgi:hypothetical protein
LYRPRDTAENVEVRLRELSFAAVVGLSAGAGGLMDGLAWLVLGWAELGLPALDLPALGLLVLVLADPPAGSVSEAGYGGTAEVVSAGDPGS